MTNDESKKTVAQDPSKSGLNDLQTVFVNEEMRFLHELLNRFERAMVDGAKPADFVREIELVLIDFQDLVTSEPKINAERAKFLMLTNLKRGLTALLKGERPRGIDVGGGRPALSLAKNEDVN